MFGPVINAKYKGLEVVFRPPRRDELVHIGKGMSNFSTLKYISIGARPEEDRIKWYEAHIDRLSGLKNDLVWVAQPKGKDISAVISFFDIKEWKSAHSGITIFNNDMLGKGLGTLSHLLLIHFGFKQLNLSYIYGDIVDGNVASVRAAEKVGYFKTGYTFKQFYVDGNYLDLLHFIMINPNKAVDLSNNAPISIEMRASIEIVEEKLKLAQKCLTYL